MTTPDSHEQLARAIDEVVRRQPPLKAPASLEARVFAEIARRAQQPWWAKSFAHWPLAARIAFVVACGAVAKLAIELTMWGVSSVSTATNAVTAAPQVTTLQAVTGALAALLSNIPGQWIQLGLLLIVGVYAAVFGLGAAAYRALYVSR
jgi:hypothetical protein